MFIGALFLFLISFYSATKSPAHPTPQLHQSQPQAQQDLFGFDEPAAPAIHPISAPHQASSNNLHASIMDPSEIAPSPKLSRSTKHLPQESDHELDFFGSSASGVRQSTPVHTSSPIASVSSIDEPVATPAEPAKPEAPKKPASALESMMENSLFKVTHKPPPMAAKAAASPAQAQVPQQKPAQPLPQLSAKRFDWSSQNYRDIFAPEAEPTPPPPSQVCSLFIFVFIFF
jgi:hypothetical protein